SDRGDTVADPEHLRDRRRSDLVVSGDHGHADPARVALLHRLDGLPTWRIEEAEQAEQDEVLGQIGGGPGSRADARIREPREGKNALAPGGKRVRGPHEVVSIDGSRLAAHSRLPVAVFEDDLGRALHQDERLASAVPVQRGHELVLRLEWDGIDARVRFLLGPALYPELAPGRVQRALGWLALHL